jgi:hypothetical protein
MVTEDEREMPAMQCTRTVLFCLLGLEDEGRSEACNTPPIAIDKFNGIVQVGDKVLPPMVLGGE